MMSEQKKLRELSNNVRIVGTLKSIDLEVKPNKNDPSVKQIMGSITVMVEDKVNNRVHEHDINLFAKESSKLFKGYLTVKNEFKAADVVGAEHADRVQITGSIDENIYMGSDGKLKEFNRNRGLFVNRVDAKSLEKQPGLANDESLAQIEIVVENIRPLTDKEGIETGEYAIDAFTVGYNNGVTKLKNIVIGQDLADVITENYEVGSTGKLTFALNNYVELEELEQEQDPFASQGGFGVTTDISNGPIKHYVRELRVIGGFPQYLDERALDEDDVKLAKQIRALKVQEIQNSVPATPQMNQAGKGGFGVNNSDPFADPFTGAGQIDISDDDLPF
jgi:hypothetical protein